MFSTPKPMKCNKKTACLSHLLNLKNSFLSSAVCCCCLQFRFFITWIGLWLISYQFFSRIYSSSVREWIDAGWYPFTVLLLPAMPCLQSVDEYDAVRGKQALPPTEPKFVQLQRQSAGKTTTDCDWDWLPKRGGRHIRDITSKLIGTPHLHDSPKTPFVEGETELCSLPLSTPWFMSIEKNIIQLNRELTLS